MLLATLTTDESGTAPSNGRSSRRSRHPGAAEPQKPRGGRESKAFLWVIGALLVAVPTVALPNGGAALGVKTFAMEAAGVILVVFLVSRGEWSWSRVKGALTAPPNLAILFFLGWVLASAARSPFPKMSQYEAMRHVGGALIYFSIVYGLSVRRHLSQFVSLLVLAISAATLLAFGNRGEDEAGRIVGAFHNDQLLAGFLVLVLPVVLVACLSEQEGWRRISAQFALVVALAGIVVSQNRSSWLGSALALLVLAVLYVATRGVQDLLKVRRHQVIIPAAVLAIGVGLFLFFSHAAGVVIVRGNSLKNLQADRDWNWRQGMWSKAIRMANRRPIWGWGVGTFPVQQAVYYDARVLDPSCTVVARFADGSTKQYGPLPSAADASTLASSLGAKRGVLAVQIVPANPPRSQKEIMDQGPNLQENAHNTYLQMAAEIGWVGLALYLAIMLAFFGTALSRLWQIESPFRQAVLAATIAAIVGQMVTGVGNPAWEFGECSLFIWVMLGLGMAVAGLGDRGRSDVRQRDAASSHGARGNRRAAAPAGV